MCERACVCMCVCVCARSRLQYTQTAQNQQIEFDKIWIDEKYESQVAQIFAHRIFLECLCVCVFTYEKGRERTTMQIKWSLRTNTHTHQLEHRKNCIFFEKTFNILFKFVLLFLRYTASLLSVLPILCFFHSILPLTLVFSLLLAILSTAVFVLLLVLFLNLKCLAYILTHSHGVQQHDTEFNYEIILWNKRGKKCYILQVVEWKWNAGLIREQCDNDVKQQCWHLFMLSASPFGLWKAIT